jgi:hypothetical protein
MKGNIMLGFQGAISTIALSAMVYIQRELNRAELPFTVVMDLRGNLHLLPNCVSMARDLRQQGQDIINKALDIDRSVHA